jgi:hypothetical protein
MLKRAVNSLVDGMTSVQHVSLSNDKHFIFGLKLLKIFNYLPGRTSYLTFKLTWFLIGSEQLLDFFILRITPIPVAAQSKAWVCGCSLPGIAGSNPAGVKDVCLL